MQLSYGEALDTLSEAVRNAGLGWVVDQVNAEVAAGKVQEESLPSFKLDPKYHERLFERDAWVAAGESKQTTRAEYDGRENLLLLLEAVERVVRDGKEMVSTVLTFAEEHHLSAQLILNDETGPLELDVSRVQIDSRREDFEEFLATLDLLKEEVTHER